MATECTGVMSVCANQSSLSRHNFGGSLATIANKGGISNSRYTRFERTYPHWVLSSNAGAVARIESQVAAGAETGRSMSDISLTRVPGLPREGRFCGARPGVAPAPSITSLAGVAGEKCWRPMASCVRPAVARRWLNQ